MQKLNSQKTFFREYGVDVGIIGAAVGLGKGLEVGSEASVAATAAWIWTAGLGVGTVLHADKINAKMAEQVARQNKKSPFEL